MNAKPEIDRELVRTLVASQFPEWGDLPVMPVDRGGWDNRTFRLGDTLVVRLPSAEAYASQAEKEQLWLPRLAPQLPLAIPVPVGFGVTGEGYPWKWTVLRWIEGWPLATDSLADLRIFAADLGRFLSALHAADATGGPLAGAHSFHRGGALAIYDAEVGKALDILRDRIDGQAAVSLWTAALATTWPGHPVWVHGDISPGNLLTSDGRLCGVIDFGQLCAGDPACDLMIAWTWLDAESRKTLRDTLPLDEGTWLRGRAWALWKALIVASGLAETNAVEYADPWRVIGSVLDDLA